MSTNPNASTEALWHYAVGGERHGPVSEQTLGKLIASGEVDGETYVWQPGMDNWLHLGEVDALAGLLAADAAAPLEPGRDASGDTVVESLESLLGRAGLAESAKAYVAANPATPAPGGLDLTKPTATATTLLESVDSLAPATASAAPRPAASAAALDDIFGDALAPRAAEPARAAAPVAAAATNPFGEDPRPADVYSRGQSSVLFSLDDLGREQGAPTDKAPDPFATDSSGLIDIKAVATQARAPVGDPFSAANLVIPARPVAAPLATPLVGRKSNVGVWIFASVAVVAAAAVAVIFLTRAPAPAAVAPTVVVAAPTPAEPSGATPASGATPGATAADPAAGSEKPEAKPAEPLPAEPPPADPAPVAVAAKTAAPTTAAPKPTTALQPAGVRKPEAARAEPRPTEVAAAPKPPEPKPSANPAGAARVDNLLAQLDSGKSGAVAADAGDGSVPQKLGAAAVRNAIRGRFGPCVAKLGGMAGPVTVQTSFVISSSGVVQSARVTDGGGTPGDVQRCVVDQIKGTKFGAFKDPTMTVNLPVKLL